MSLTFLPNDTSELKPRITVVGVGGAGSNAVNNMIQSHLEGVEFIVANTDAQSLAHSRTDRRIQLGTSTTQGLGAGSRPDIGRASAEESLDEIMTQMQNSNMVFITAGMGGGTGTGAAPVIARAARESGILTIGVVTKPFNFEGAHRMRTALAGIEELQQFVDTLIVIPNQNLFLMATPQTTFAEAFRMADNVLYSGVRSVTDLMIQPGLINLDFADVRSIMSEMGKAMMGTGEASGEKRAREAAERAISNPLLDDVSMRGARGILVNITGGADITLFEVDEAVNCIKSEVDPDANIIFGSTTDENLEGLIRVSVVATGIESPVSRPATISLSDLPKETDAPETTAKTPSEKAPATVEPSAPVQQTVTPSVTALRTEAVVAEVPAPVAAIQEPPQTAAPLPPSPAPTQQSLPPLPLAPQQPQPSQHQAQMQTQLHQHQQSQPQQPAYPQARPMSSNPPPVAAVQRDMQSTPRRAPSLLDMLVRKVRGGSTPQEQPQRRAANIEPTLRKSPQEMYPNAPLRQQANVQQGDFRPIPETSVREERPAQDQDSPARPAQSRPEVDLDVPTFLRRQTD